MNIKLNWSMYNHSVPSVKNINPTQTGLSKMIRMKKFQQKTKRCLLFLTFSVIAMAVDGQSRVDKINSDSAAMQFFRQEIIGTHTKSNFNDFKLISGKEWIDFYNFNPEQKQDLLSVYNYQKWAKVDLNGDKKTDLIISGYLSKKTGYSTNYRLFIFLAGENDTYNAIKYNSSVPAYFRVLKEDGKELIEFSRWTNDLYKKVPDVPLRIDTLEFHPEFEMLIDHKKLESPSTISKIVYTENYLPKGKLQAVVENNLDKNADFIISEDSEDGKKPVINKAKIAKDMMKDFLDVVVRLQTYKKTKEASIIMTDDFESKTLEVFYTDGSKKMISDDTGESSYTLSAIYQWMQMSIRNVYEQISQRNQQNTYYDPFDW